MDEGFADGINVTLLSCASTLFDDALKRNDVVLASAIADAVNNAMFDTTTDDGHAMATQAEALANSMYVGIEFAFAQ